MGLPADNTVTIWNPTKFQNLNYIRCQKIIEYFELKQAILQICTSSLSSEIFVGPVRKWNSVLSNIYGKAFSSNISFHFFCYIWPKDMKECNKRMFMFIIKALKHVCKIWQYNV